MFKLIDEFRKDLNYEQLGRLADMYCREVHNEKVEKSEDRVLNFLYKTAVQPAAQKYKNLCRQNSMNSKGHGRPRKEKKDNGRENGN